LKAVRTGQLRHRVKLQSKTSTQNSDGSLNYTWTTYATVWAQVTPMSGKESKLSDVQIEAFTTHKVTIRYNSAVTPDDKLVFGTRTLNIASVLNVDEEKVWQVLSCEEPV
jgi:SPP1 family predicted phage head-tail adaptor